MKSYTACRIIKEHEQTEAINMRTVTLEEAQGHLDELATLVEQGEEVELIRPGKPTLKIVMDKSNRVAKPRTFGQYAGQPYSMSEDFDAPLPDAFWLGEERS
jgi:antitoxin (DNA-binding transcriptional repressor) of toxin-antitoxin stability system